MDFWTVLGAVLSSVGASASAAAWLTKRLLDHRLKKDFETFKVSLSRELQHDKASWEGQVRQEVETRLGERAAEREYRLDARKRLYTAVGPLKFQLVVACRDYASRISAYGLGARYKTDIKNYYGKSTLYRLLKPLALSELIEREMTYSDFSVDPSVVNLLRFKRAAFAAFTGSSIVVNGQPGVNWEDEDQHIFYDNLSRAANAIIAAPDNQTRVFRFHEFDEFLKEAESRRSLEPLPRLLHSFDLSMHPILWIRLVSFGLLCSTFEQSVGAHIGFDEVDYPLYKLIEACEDPFVRTHLSEYESACRGLVGRAKLSAITPIDGTTTEPVILSSE